MVRQQINVVLAAAVLAGAIGLPGCRTTCRNATNSDYYCTAEAPGEVNPHQSVETETTAEVAEADEDERPAVAPRPAQPVPYEDATDEQFVAEQKADDAELAPAPAPSRPVSDGKQRITALEVTGATVELNDDGDVVSVDFANIPVGDKDIAALAELPELGQLNLRGTSITDAGLKYLVGLENLKLLDLDNTQITDGGLAILAELTGLEYLLLGQTQITDDGLKSLASLRNLQGLSVVGVALSRSALDDLRAALPDCQVVADTPMDQAADDSVSIVGPSTPVAPKAMIESIPEPEFDGGVVRPLRAPTVSEPIEDVPAPESDNGSLFEGADRQTAPITEPDISQKKADEIISVVRATLPSSDAETLIQYRLGVALARSGDTEAALPHLIVAVGEAEAHYTLGVIEYQNALEAGRRQFSKALELQGDYGEARFWLEEINRQQSRTPRLDNPFQVVRSYDLLPLPLINPGRTPSPAPAVGPELRQATLTTGPRAR